MITTNVSDKPNDLHSLMRRNYVRILEHKEEILEAFIAKYGCEPDEMEIVETRGIDEVSWRVRKKTNSALSVD